MCDCWLREAVVVAAIHNYFEEFADAVALVSDVSYCYAVRFAQS